MKNHLIDINNLVDVLVGINELLPKEQGGIDKVDGWLEGYTNENPYLGRGSLIYIKYTNEGLGNQVKYYAFNDTQVINLSFMFIKKLKSSEVLITDYLSVIAHKLLQTITNTTGWITDIVIKDDYKSKYGIPQSFTRFHTSHGFNMKNFISDLNTIIHNPSCVSKFVAAQCRIAMSEEARPKVEEARPRREGTGLRRYDSHGRRDGSRPNNRYGSRVNDGNGSRPNNRYESRSNNGNGSRANNRYGSRSNDGNGSMPNNRYGSRANDGNGSRPNNRYGSRANGGNGSRPNNHYESRSNNGNGSRPNRYGSSSGRGFQRSYNRDSRPARY